MSCKICFNKLKEILITQSWRPVVDMESILSILWMALGSVAWAPPSLAATADQLPKKAKFVLHLILLILLEHMR